MHRQIDLEIAFLNQGWCKFGGCKSGLSYSRDFGKEKFLLPSNVCRYAYNHILNFLLFPELEKNLHRSNESFRNPVSQCSMSEVTRLILFPKVMGSPL